MIQWKDHFCLENPQTETMTQRQMWLGKHQPRRGASFTPLILGVDRCSEKPVSNSVCVCPAVTEEWQKKGGQPWQLIEPVDGFHPNEVRAVM